MKVVRILVDIYPSAIAKLEEIGRSGNASNDHEQDFQFCLIKAIEEFIKKYDRKEKIKNR